MVAKYSERCVRISECAYIIRFRAVISGAKGETEDVEEDGRVGDNISDLRLGEGGGSAARRSRQTNSISPVSVTFQLRQVFERKLVTYWDYQERPQAHLTDPLGHNTRRVERVGKDQQGYGFERRLRMNQCHGFAYFPRVPTTMEGHTL